MKTKAIGISLYIGAIVIFLAHFLYTKGAVYGDGRYYFSYLPTVFVYHTLNFTQAFKHLGIDWYLTPLHFPANKYSIGSALVWAFPYELSNLLLIPFRAADGYTAFYQIALGIWNISLVFAGLYFVRKMLLGFFSQNISNLTVLFLFLATNLLFYGAVDVINSHSASFFTASVLTYLWLQKKSIKQSILLGFFLGILTLIRSQDIVFAILPISTLLIERKKYILNFLVIGLSGFLTLVPQLLLWKTFWGSWYINPYLFHERFYFFRPNFVGVLLSPNNGLLLWTPLIAACAVGLVLFAKKYKTIGISMLCVVALELYVVSAWSTWWQGASYSGRMFVSSLPLLAFGLAYVLSQEKYKKYTIPTGVILSGLNIVLIVAYLLISHHHTIF